ncbi:hypothetical protein NNC19_04140 [Clostridium sp. SHJSY1]|uniref:hypothetical protein n=1 Tax=Clostridium sp. SHJSY1 TaxID=2942483 RepID=UPI0028762659|nr:hypothetical protein [Clostridium sp. SHJSY1]MDS0524858.1 hypothetical protein [Clostridium sp. SHJSY1]
MSFFSSSSSSSGRHYGHKHRGSSYYKREGILSGIKRIFTSHSHSGRRRRYYSSSSIRGHHRRRHHSISIFSSSWS